MTATLPRLFRELEMKLPVLITRFLLICIYFSVALFTVPHVVIHHDLQTAYDSGVFQHDSSDQASHEHGRSHTDPSHDQGHHEHNDGSDCNICQFVRVIHSSLISFPNQLPAVELSLFALPELHEQRLHSVESRSTLSARGPPCSSSPLMT